MSSDLIAAIVDPANVIAFGVALCVFATVITLTMPLMQGDKLEARMKSVATQREALRRASRAQITGARDALRQTDNSFYKKVVESLQLSRLLEDTKVTDKLAQAGLRGPRPASIFYFCRFSLPFLFAISVALYLNFINSFGLVGMQRFAAMVVGLAVGFYAPNIYLHNVISKRAASINATFPDALDLLLICIESGMSVEAALQKVAGEIGTASIELAEELALLNAELSYLPERRSAYEGMAKRNNHPGIKAVVTAMIQSERYGTPLGSALRIMAKENREMRMSAAEKKAAQLPAKLTVPMIVFFLPVLFIVILTPGIMSVMNGGKKPVDAPSSASAKR